MATDAFDLQRFVAAQDAGGIYQRAVSELRAGRKTTHWIWFVFPQIAGLGFSEMSRRYAIGSLAEARAYLAHPLLGSRLIECCTLVLNAPGTAEDVMGSSIDAQKLWACAALFMQADPRQPVFKQVLDRFFAGRTHAETDSLLNEAQGARWTL